MIDLSEVARIKWDLEKGQRLKQLRGKVSRRELEERINKACSHQYIQKVEEGDVDTIALDLLDTICEALEIPIGQVIRVFSSEISK